jgi:hypothetical protein
LFIFYCGGILYVGILPHGPHLVSIWKIQKHSWGPNQKSICGS